MTLSSSSAELKTGRLRLVPSVPAHLLALMENAGTYERLSGLRLAEGLSEMMGAASPAYAEHLKQTLNTDPWTVGFTVALQDEALAIGIAGFKGPPDGEGMVEIAYGIAPEHQNLGYATEAAAALVEFARRDPRVRLIRAHTLPERNASGRVLEKCGIAQVGEVIDPEDGRVWRWERKR